MATRITFGCNDCGYTQEVSKRKAYGMYGLRCPKCNGPLWIPPPSAAFKAVGEAVSQGIKAGIKAARFKEVI